MSLDADLIDAARTAARKAAEVHRVELGHLSPENWSEKGTADFVTEVDREAERRIIRHLQDRFPTHSFLAEEGTNAREPINTGAPIQWIIDPLDGTTNWLHGYPEYAVSIAALDADGLRAAVVINSATGEEFDAVMAERFGPPRSGISDWRWWAPASPSSTASSCHGICVPSVTFSSTRAASGERGPPLSIFAPSLAGGSMRSGSSGSCRGMWRPECCS
jgi:hypothetical protein